MPVTFSKLKTGNWGLRSTDSLTLGQAVTVSKRDGSTSTETPGTLVASGAGWYLYTIGAKAQTTTPSRRRREPMGAGHGRADHGIAGYSSYCTDNASCRCYDCAS